MMSRAVGKIMFALQPTAATTAAATTRTTSLVVMLIVGLLFQLLLLIPGRDCSSGGGGGELALASSSSSASSGGGGGGSVAPFSLASPSHASAPKIMRIRSSGGGQTELLDRRGHSAEAAALLGASGGGGGGGAGEKPKLIPLVASDSGYSENSSVNILCTVSQGHHETLTFDWFKDGQLLLSSSPVAAGTDELPPPRIESQPDHSLLRVSRVKSQHAGRYTCSAKNQFGQDSSSVNLLVNVKLQWSREPPKEIFVSLNQELKVDCLAQGEPKPSMRWEKLDSPTMSQQQQQQQPHGQTTRLRPFSHSDSSSFGGGGGGGGLGKNQLAATAALGGKQQSGGLLVSSSRYLSIGRAKESDGGLYECIASNGHDADLRKLIYVQVRGPPKILPIATADSYPEGSSINLICTVSGGQRRGLSLSWTLNGEQLDAEKIKFSEAFENVSIGGDDADISFLKIKNATHANSGQYTCTAKNPLGQDSTSVQIVINVELKWSKLPQDSAEVGLNQELVMECDAVGSPPPTIEWLKHSPVPDRNGTIVPIAKGKFLKIARAQHRDSGLYECIAKNGVDDQLRKIIQVKVRGPPKILPIASADSYPEGSTINLICTVSGGQRKGLSLAWTKDGAQLGELLNSANEGPDGNLSIEKTGIDISILRISNASHTNSGRYACNAKNPLGEDSTSVQIVINVELKWNKIPSDTEVGLNQDASIECDAVGQPQPQIVWTKHPSSSAKGGAEGGKSAAAAVVVSQSKFLKLTKAQNKDSGLYECVARNGVDQDLRRLIQVRVRVNV